MRSGARFAVPPLCVLEPAVRASSSALTVGERDLSAAPGLLSDHTELQATDLRAAHGHDQLHVAVGLELVARERELLDERLLLAIVEHRRHVVDKAALAIVHVV